jgi:hypothetical protein
MNPRIIAIPSLDADSMLGVTENPLWMMADNPPAMCL